MNMENGEWRREPGDGWKYVSSRGQILIGLRAGELWRASGFGYVVGGQSSAQALHLLALLLREEVPNATSVVRGAAAIFPEEDGKQATADANRIRILEERMGFLWSVARDHILASCACRGCQSKSPCLYAAFWANVWDSSEKDR